MMTVQDDKETGGDGVNSSSLLEEMQRRIQDTTGGADDSEDETNRAIQRSPAPTAECSGLGGCRESFPVDQAGAEFQWAMLCASCFSNGHLQGNFVFLFVVMLTLNNS